jgi:hypothetical protein
VFTSPRGYCRYIVFRLGNSGVTVGAESLNICLPETPSARGIPDWVRSQVPHVLWGLMTHVRVWQGFSLLMWLVARANRPPPCCWSPEVNFHAGRGRQYPGRESDTTPEHLSYTSLPPTLGPAQASTVCALGGHTDIRNIFGHTRDLMLTTGGSFARVWCRSIYIHDRDQTEGIVH